MIDRYRPILNIFEPARPTMTPSYRSILAEELLKQTVTSPGLRSNIDWLTLRPDEKLTDQGMPGREPLNSEYRPPAIILNHDIRWVDTTNCSWEYTPSSDETAWRTVQLASMQTALDALNALGSSTWTDAQASQAAALTESINQLAVGGEGYLRTVTDLMGSGVTGIWWGLSVPNIPVTIKSAFATDKNRAISFRLARKAAPETQARFSFTIEIGAGQTLYALKIGEDGNSSEFYHYNNLDPDVRDALIIQREEVLDSGRLTVDDIGNINTWQASIDKIKKASKEAGNKQLGADDSVTVSTLEAQIKALKDSKRGLTVSDQDTLNDIDNKLFVCPPMKLSLQESEKTQIDTPFDITFHFLRAGYVIIQTRDGQKIYENKLVTGQATKGMEPVFADLLPEGAQIVLKSDGGQWLLCYGNPLYDFIGQVTTQPFYLPSVPTDDTVEWIVDGDAANPGCSLEFNLLPTLDGQYQAQITMRSDGDTLDGEMGRYTPELYYCGLHIQATEITSLTQVWSSASDLKADGSSRIMDAAVQQAESKSKLAQIILAAKNSSLPKHLAGKACDVVMHDVETSSNVVVLLGGYITDAQHLDQYPMGLSNGKITTNSPVGHVAHISAIGCDGFLTSEISAPIPGNNFYVGDYLRALCRDAGLVTSWYSSIPEGAANGCPKMPAMIPGSFPDIVPAAGAQYWEWMTEVVKKHAPRWSLYANGDGIKFSLKFDRIRSDVWYSDSAPVSSHNRIRRKSTEGGGVTVYQDLRKYYTKVTVIGDFDPSSGMRYAASAEIPQAYLPAFSSSAYYIGQPRVHTMHVDDSLHSEDECLQVARDLLHISPATPNGLTPWYQVLRVHLDWTLDVGDIITVNGLKHRVEEVKYATMNSKQSDDYMMTITCQLAEDRNLTSG